MRISGKEEKMLLSYYGGVSFEKKLKWYQKSKPKKKAEDDDELKPNTSFAVLESAKDERSLRKVLIIFFSHAHFFEKISQNFVSQMFSAFKIGILKSHFEQFNVHFDRQLFISKMRDGLIRRFFPKVRTIAHSFFLSEELRLRAALIRSIEADFIERDFEDIDSFKGT